MIAWRYEYHFLLLKTVLIFTYSLCSFVKYCFHHSKKIFISSRHSVISSTYFHCNWQLLSFIHFKHARKTWKLVEHPKLRSMWFIPSNLRKLQKSCSSGFLKNSRPFSERAKLTQRVHVSVGNQKRSQLIKSSKL